MRLLYSLALLALSISQSHAAQIALIIDDIGYRHTDQAVLALPSTVTLSVLPHTPLGKELANAGHKKGHEIMLHLPMQALNGKALGLGGLTNTMTETQIRASVVDAINSVPFAKGANNHMGSLLTQLDDPMLWVMETLKQKHLYFVDSMTTRFTKAGETADQLGVPLLKRQLFLDNDTSATALERQFNLMISQAHTQGSLVAIAHPYPETMRFLKANLQRLKTEGIDLVPASSLLPIGIAQKGGTNPAVTLR
ncbi:divergent polysaccharide deacetylase family protein [Morganella morganii]|nr:divergent polysaccharide deacetylase family protein [Morganella morganii]